MLSNRRASPGEFQRRQRIGRIPAGDALDQGLQGGALVCDPEDPLERLVLPAYDCVIKCSHYFNVLDARGAISVTERQRYIGRVRHIARAAAESWYAQREALGFPLLRDQKQAAE